MSKRSSKRPVGGVQDLGGGRWRLFVELRGDDGRRRRATRVVRAKSEREARQLHAAFATEAQAATPATEDDDEDAERTVDDLLDAWLANVVDVAPSTLGNWREDLRRYVRPHIGTRSLEVVDACALDDLYRALERDGGKGGRPLSGATVRRVHTPLRLAFAQAVRWRWLATNPALDATPARAKPREIVPPSAAERVALLDAAVQLGPQWPAAVRLAVVTGCRRGELCGLRWSDIDLEGATVTFRRSVRVVASRAVVSDELKTASSRRTIGIDAATVAALTTWRRQAVERGLAAGAQVGSDAFVFTNDAGGRRPWHPAYVTHRWELLRRRAGLRGVRLHDLRHAMATEALAAGVDVRTVAGRGGWANGNTLLRTYAHFVPARDRDAADLLARLVDDQVLQRRTPVR